MATCGDCVHVELCDEIIGSRINCKECAYFKNRSDFIELPEGVDSDKIITLDDAIAHCIEVANGANDRACPECKSEHLILASWLHELQLRRERELDEVTVQIGDKSQFEECEKNAK